MFSPAVQCRADAEVRLSVCAAGARQCDIAMLMFSPVQNKSIEFTGALDEQNIPIKNFGMDSKTHDEP